MPLAPALDFPINVADPNKKGLLAFIDGQLAASNNKLPKMIRNDAQPINYYFVKPSISGVRQFDYIDVSTAVVRDGIGLPDLAPTTGTFFLQVGTQITADLPYGSTPAAVQAALNALSNIIAQGGVTVAAVGNGYQVTWNTPGTQGSIPVTLARSTGALWSPLPSVTGYTGGGSTKLDGTATVGAALNSYFVVTINGVMSVWQLVAGIDATNVPAGVVRPTDYNAATNAVNLVRVEGL